MKQLFVLPLLMALVYGQAPKDTLLSGKIRHLQWTKSTQSYCAQGSDYYALETKGHAWVLETPTDWTPNALRLSVGKTVKMRGEIIVRTIAPDPMSQHPVSYGPDGKQAEDVFRCEVFRVRELVRKK